MNKTLLSGLTAVGLALSSGASADIRSLGMIDDTAWELRYDTEDAACAARAEYRDGDASVIFIVGSEDAALHADLMIFDEQLQFVDREGEQRAVVRFGRDNGKSVRVVMDGVYVEDGFLLMNLAKEDQVLAFAVAQGLDVKVPGFASGYRLDGSAKAVRAAFDCAKERKAGLGEAY